jgi:serine/threonine-protein kinase
MAEIYKADDTHEDKTVAVKILKNEFAENEEFLRRFRNEAKAIALLSHPNIAKIFDVGFTESVQFIVMEYIDGITLIDYIERQGVLKWREALGFVRQILKALQHAHDRGIVHRDVKSQNVMLLRDGTIKVMDFGIARFNREIDKTMAEKAIGSVHYISPEQARGDITDEKSDLYSVGVMLYEMLTGVKPFDGNDALAIALMHTNKTPKNPTAINSTIPEGIEEITLRAMQKEPVKRYQTAGEMLNDLQEFEKNPNIIFEYKYSTPDGNTKFFDKIGKPAPAVVPVPVKVDEEFYDEDEEEYDDDDIAERRSPLLPILFAVASAVIIVAAVVVALLFGGVIGGDDGWNPVRQTRTMPNLINLNYDQAAELYTWLQMVPTQEYSSEFPRGTIMHQDIREGNSFNPSQTKVNVIVSQGREIILFPDFGDDLLLASYVSDELEKMGFRVSRKQAYHDTVLETYFIRADKKPGDELSRNDLVTIYVSLGKEDNPGDNKTRVPDMIGSSEATARDNAQRHRIVLNVKEQESSEEMRGRVVRQVPEKDTEVDDFSIVEVFIGTGPAVIEIKKSNITFSIESDIPEEWRGDYIFKRYINNELVDTRNFRLDPNTVVPWEFENTGTHEYSIVIMNPRNGMERLYCIYEINFDVEGDPIKNPKERNLNVLSELNPPPVVTTEFNPYNPPGF